MAADLEIRTALGGLNEALEEAAAFKGKRAGEYLFTKGQQLLLGNRNPRFGATFPGLAERLAWLQPPEGAITAERLGALDALSGGPGRKLPVKVRPSSAEAAARLLGEGEAGVFQIARPNPPRLGRIVRVKVFTKGKRAGKRSVSGRAKTAEPLLARGAELRPGDVVLNRKSLAVALELKRREQGRGSLAAGFLPQRNRRLRKPRGAGYFKLRVRNKTGYTLGSFDFSATDALATVRVVGYLEGTGIPAAQREAAKVIRDVVRDTRTYIAGKEKQALERSIRTQTRRLERLGISL